MARPHGERGAPRWQSRHRRWDTNAWVSKKLSLVDVLAQSVGFMGPVFSAAFIIPLIIGVNFAARGAGTSAAAVGRVGCRGRVRASAGSSRNTRSASMRPARCTTTCRRAGKTLGAAGGWLYYAGTIILTIGLGVLLGGYIKDILLPTRSSIEGDLPIWVLGRVCVAGLLFAVLYLGVQISTRVQLTLAMISVAVVLVCLRHRDRELGDANDFGKALDPSPAGGFSGILFGVLYGVLIFVGFETAANLAEETAEPQRSIPRAVLERCAGVDLLRDRGLRRGGGVRVRPGAIITRPRWPGHRCSRSEPPGRIRVGVLAEDPDPGGLPRHAGGLRRRRRWPRRVACSRWRATADCRRRWLRSSERLRHAERGRSCS